MPSVANTSALVDEGFSLVGNGTINYPVSANGATRGLSATYDFENSNHGFTISGNGCFGKLTETMSDNLRCS